MAEPPDPNVVAQAAISYSEFLELKNKGTFDNVLKVVLHHTEGSIKIPQKEIFPELLRISGLQGGFVGNFHCSTVNFIKEKNKNAKKLVIFCKTEEVAKKILALGNVELFGHSISITDNEFEKVADAAQPVVVHTAIKKIEVSGFNVNTIAMLISILREQYADFEDKDIMVSREQLRLSITVSKFKKIVPVKSSFSKGRENHTYYLKASGYDQTEIRSDLADKPKMAELFEKSISNQAKKEDTWLNSFNPIKPRKNPSKVVTCYYCGVPGHSKKQCPKFEEFVKNLVCYNCGGRGHTSHTCTKPSQKEEKRCYACDEPGHFQWQKNKCKKYDENRSVRERFSRGRRGGFKGRSRNGTTIDLTGEDDVIEKSTPNATIEEDSRESESTSSSSEESTASTVESKHSDNDMSEEEGADVSDKEEEVKSSDKEEEEEKASSGEADVTNELLSEKLPEKVAENVILPESQPAEVQQPSTVAPTQLAVQQPPTVEPPTQVRLPTQNNFQPHKDSKLKSTKAVASTTLAKENPSKKSEQSSKNVVKNIRNNFKDSKSTADKKKKEQAFNNNRPNLRKSTTDQTSSRQGSSTSSRSRNKSGPKANKISLGDFQKNHNNID